ncbi:PREDICTED: putative leucine-rich repeat [Prunus dulcis]|uniref:PREDICTED: putative leucine-rich repeat n=1 Tax=Prunus dulcis TaxID=3755 RepID=A0A5E4FNL7_PRUDU|nr:PREDICTED: putative leucine-rich repeat [Prunus dulcis]
MAIIASLLTVAVLPATVSAVPLSTSSRWIVDESGQSVKLACMNWVSHLEPVVAEGLSKQSVDAISKRIASLGFNCIRLRHERNGVDPASYDAVSIGQNYILVNYGRFTCGSDQFGPGFSNDTDLFGRSWQNDKDFRSTDDDSTATIRQYRRRWSRCTRRPSAAAMRRR